MLDVIIHVGPPKSGTSAIQKWLSNNTENLKKGGVYYPPHTSDPNGISSGNVWSIFSRDSHEKLSFDRHRYAELVLEAQRKNCQKILLSSEFFFQNIQILAEEIPNAKFIAYLRFPAEVIESAYNQGVKRHGEVKAFGIEEQPKYFQVHVLFREVKAAGVERFQLRPYHPDCFVAGDIVTDFLAALGWSVGSVNLKVNSERVNKSYSLEALEFKRWFNQFELTELQSHLDIFLQSYKGKVTDYSLISPQVFEVYRNTYLKILNDVGEFFHIVNLGRFIQGCKQQQQRPFAKQKISDRDFIKIADDFLSVNPGFQSAIYKLLCLNGNSNQNLKNPHRIKLIKGLISWKVKVKCRVLNKFGFLSKAGENEAKNTRAT